MRVLIIAEPEPGHIVPLSNVADLLIATGHEVGWTCFPPSGFGFSRLPRGLLDALRQRGITMVECGPLRAADATSPEDPLAALEEEARALLAIMPEPVTALRASIQSFAPDWTIVDPSSPLACMAVRLAGVRHALVSTNLFSVAPPSVRARCRFAHTNTAEAEIVQALATWSERLGVPAASQPRFETAFATEAFVGEGAPSHVSLVGPSLPSAERVDRQLVATLDWQSGPLQGDAPLVYVTFGTQLRQTDRWLALTEVAATLDVRMLVSASPWADPERARLLARNVLVVPYAPQPEVLARASVCVHHGGANTLTESLCAGVPQLVAPLCTDGPVSGYFVRTSGVGLWLEDSPSREQWRDALIELLRPDSTYRTAARRVQASYQLANGASTIARWIAELEAITAAGT